MFNNVVLIGRLARDPEIKHTGSGISWTTFTLAVDRPFTNQKDDSNGIRRKAWEIEADDVRFLQRASSSHDEEAAIDIEYNAPFPI